MADDLLELERHRGRARMPRLSRQRTFVPIIGTNNVVDGKAINYELGFTTDGSTVELVMLASDRDGYILSFESDDIYTLYRLCEFFGRVEIRPVGENVDSFFAFLSREEEPDIEEQHELSDDVHAIIELLLTEDIPGSIVQFVVENPGIVPPFLTTEELAAGTVAWEEAMAEAGILKPEQVDVLYAEIARIEQRYTEILAHAAASMEYVTPGENNDDIITRAQQRYDYLFLSLLIGYEYLREEERSGEIALFLALVLFLNQFLGKVSQNLILSIKLYAPFIAAWLKENCIECDQIALVSSALQIADRMLKGERETVLLYDSRAG